MIEDIAEEITEPDLSALKRLGIDEIALVKGQKNYCAVLVTLEYWREYLRGGQAS